MSPFNAIEKVPGVYIDEIDVQGPIPGVGTSTPAIVGPAADGPINEPTLVTNVTQFTDTFGGFITAPHVYATHAVHGFFLNGGSKCYFVRAGTGVHASSTFKDTNGSDTFVVKAQEEGIAGNSITVAVEDASIVAGVDLARATANITTASNNTATVDDASGFRPGDQVHLDDTTNSEDATIASISGTTQITFTADLANSYAGGTMRVADVTPGRKKFRVIDATGLEAGSYINIKQGSNEEDAVVSAVDATNGFVTVQGALQKTYTLAAADAATTVKSLEFKLTVNNPNAPSGTSTTETFSNLSMDSGHQRYYGAIVQSDHVTVSGPDTPNPTPAPANRPAVVSPAAALSGGQDDDIAGLQASHYQKAIDTLESIDAVTMLCVPDSTSLSVQGYMVAHCEKMQDRFAILDPTAGATPSNGIQDQRDALASARGYAALYYPRICISDPSSSESDATLMVPPSGHIAGVFARTDEQKGVHKAPANEGIKGVLDLERKMTDAEMGILNEKSINVLRAIRGEGFKVWGARTIATSTQWRYVNVRRLLLFIEESLQEGTQSAVFEPNTPALWASVKRQVTAFLTNVWKSGALFGRTPEEGFSVRIDEELNPPDVIALGQLIIEVKLRPSTPAEFIVFRIIQDPSRALVQE